MNTISYNFGIATLSRLILGGISLVTIGILTRQLGPAGYGHYSLIFAYLYIFGALADLGLNTILVREISRPGADENRITGNIFTLRLFLIIGFVISGVVISFFLSYPIEVKAGIALTAIFTICSSLSQVLVGVFQKYLRLYFVSAADISSRVVQLILLLVVAKLHVSLLAFISAVVISELARFAIILTFTRRIVPLKLVFDLGYWRKTVVTALPIAISLVFVLLYFKMDTVLLSLMKPAYDVGVYSVAYKILEVVIFLPALYIGLVMPILSRHALGDPAEFSKIFRRSFDTLAIFGLPIMAFIYLRAADIVNLISGPGYSQSAGALKVLSVAIMLIFFGNLGGNALVALNLQKKGVWIYLTGAVFNIGANIIFIPKFSYMATAWTTALTELLITVLLFWLIKKHTGASIELNTAFKAVLATTITAVALSYLNLGFVVFSSLSLSYFIILYLLGGFTFNDFRSVILARAGKATTD